MLLRVCRENEYRTVRVTPVKKKDGSYALGLWVKDDISGIGTITYTDGERFAALGHSINDNDTGIMFRVSDGAVYETGRWSNEAVYGYNISGSVPARDPSRTFLKGMGQHRNLARMAGRVDDRNDIIRDFVPEYR